MSLWTPKDPNTEPPSERQTKQERIIRHQETNCLLMCFQTKHNRNRTENCNQGSPQWKETVIPRLREPVAASGRREGTVRPPETLKWGKSNCRSVPCPLSFHWVNPGIKCINNGYNYQVCFCILGLLPLLGTSSRLPLQLLLFLCIIGNDTEKIEEWLASLTVGHFFTSVVIHRWEYANNQLTFKTVFIIRLRLMRVKLHSPHWVNV